MSQLTSIAFDTCSWIRCRRRWTAALSSFSPSILLALWASFARAVEFLLRFSSVFQVLGRVFLFLVSFLSTKSCEIVLTSGTHRMTNPIHSSTGCVSSMVAVLTCFHLWASSRDSSWKCCVKFACVGETLIWTATLNETLYDDCDCEIAKSFLSRIFVVCEILNEFDCWKRRIRSWKLS